MLTKRMQYQAIVDRLAGLPVRHTPADFEGRLKSLWEALEKAASGREAQALYDVPGTPFERMELVDMIGSLKPGDDIGRLPTMSEVCRDMLPIEWLWPGWIPRGMLTVLGASQGSGKSFVALDLAYRIIHNHPFPDGSPSMFTTDQNQRSTDFDQNKKIIYIDAEMVPQILDERAQNYQIDRSRLFVMLPDNFEMIDFGSDKYKDRLVEMVALLRPSLVIVDSLSSIHSRGQNNVEDVRSLLGFLAQVAASYQIALLLIHHIRKPSGGQGMLTFDLSMEDLSGTGHITAMARVVLGLHVIQTGPTFDPNGPRELKMLKTNLGPFEKSLSFEFAPLHPKGVYLKWSQEAPKPYQEPRKADECAAWLLETLQDASEPLLPKDIVALAADVGFSRRSVYRARQTLAGQITNTHGRKHPDNAWQLTTPPYTDDQD